MACHSNPIRYKMKFCWKQCSQFFFCKAAIEGELRRSFVRRHTMKKRNKSKASFQFMSMICATPSNVPSPGAWYVAQQTKCMIYAIPCPVFSGVIAKAAAVKMGIFDAKEKYLMQEKYIQCNRGGKCDAQMVPSYTWCQCACTSWCKKSTTRVVHHTSDKHWQKTLWKFFLSSGKSGSNCLSALKLQ